MLRIYAIRYSQLSNSTRQIPANAATTHAEITR